MVKNLFNEFWNLSNLYFEIVKYFEEQKPFSVA